MSERKKSSKARIGARAGKQPKGNVETTLDSSKYRAGGAVLRSKKGGIIRKPMAKIRYKKTH
jgi:hypothetical protein